MSLRDLSFLMLTISDNAAADAVTAAVGIPAVNDRLSAIGCRETVVVESLQAMFDGVASDLGHRNYPELVAAQDGEMGPEAQAMATDPERIDRCRALDPLQTSRTTARDATRLLAAVWGWHCRQSASVWDASPRHVPATDSASRWGGPRRRDSGGQERWALSACLQ